MKADERDKVAQIVRASSRAVEAAWLHQTEVVEYNLRDVISLAKSCGCQFVEKTS